MVAIPNGESTPVGVWLDADEGVTAKDKNGNELVNTLGRKQVKAGGKGTQRGAGRAGERASGCFRNGKHQRGECGRVQQEAAFVWPE